MNKDHNTFKIGLWGALIGAGAAAAAISLRDEKNRKKVSKFLHDVKKRLGEKADEIQETGENKGGEH